MEKIKNRTTQQDHQQQDQSQYQNDVLLPLHLQFVQLIQHLHSFEITGFFFVCQREIAIVPYLLGFVIHIERFLVGFTGLCHHPHPFVGLRCDETIARLRSYPIVLHCRVGFVHRQPIVPFYHIIIRYICTLYPLAEPCQKLQRFLRILLLRQEVQYQFGQLKHRDAGIQFHCFQIIPRSRVPLLLGLTQVATQGINPSFTEQSVFSRLVQIMKSRICIILIKLKQILIAIPTGRITLVSDIPPHLISQTIGHLFVIQSIVIIHYLKEACIESPFVSFRIAFPHRANHRIQPTLFHRHQIGIRCLHTKIVIIECIFLSERCRIHLQQIMLHTVIIHSPQGFYLVEIISVAPASRQKQAREEQIQQLSHTLTNLRLFNGITKRSSPVHFFCIPFSKNSFSLIFLKKAMIRLNKMSFS